MNDVQSKAAVMQILPEGQRCSAREHSSGHLYRYRGQCTREAVVLYRGRAYCAEHDPRHKRLEKLMAEYRGLSCVVYGHKHQLDQDRLASVDYKERDKWILQRTRELVRDGVIQDPQLEEWCQRVADMEDERKQQLQQKLKETSARAAALVTKIQNLQTAMRKDYAKKEVW